MCGISGIIFNNSRCASHHVSYYLFLKKINNIDSIFNSDSKLNLLFNLSWQYKNDTAFINYVRDFKEQEYVRKIIRKLDEFLIENDNFNKKNYSLKIGSKIEKIKDIKWFFENELSQTYNFVTNFIDSDLKSINDSAIIFLKNLCSITNSINFLEMRGRDSLGISINLNLKNLNFKIPKNIGNIVVNREYKQFTSISFVFKTSNSIGYLGENSEVIIKQIKINNLIKKLLLNSTILNGSIIYHTRWASVGKVNDYNCHPISNYKNDSSRIPYIHAFVNGDIYNYKEISDKALNRFSFKSKCDSDTLAVPYLFTDKNIRFKDNFIKSKLNQLVGSYALAIEVSSEPSKILISKSGSQGLYIGISENSFMFSSDVYGLVENCRFYYSMPSDHYFFLDRGNNQFPLILNSLNKERKKRIKSDDFVESLITTRDISKIDYSHFLEKEINETESILNRTCLNHIDIKKLKNNKTNFFGSQFTNIDKQIIEKIKDNSFDEIIITGMGTCYTAAVVISRYMRNVLRYQNPKIIVQPHIASEGSAFYLKSNMKNTLVVVIAQSGTTIDTNVYVKLAKTRGAKTISIINKRDGDVTFLVDSSIYLGNGRDIEIAVPSTKTFNAHIVTGYLLTLFFYSNTKKPNKDFLINDANRIIQSPILARESIKKFHNLKLSNKFLDSFLFKKNWFMIHDDTELSATCQEVRIKLSECCYSSVPYHNLEYLKLHEINNSVIIMMIGNKKSISIQELKKLSKSNYIYIISDKFSCNIKNVSILSTPNTQPSFSFLPSVIFGQLLSYKIALRMDERKKFIQELIDKNFSKAATFNLQQELKNNLFIKGIEKKDLESIERLSKSNNNIKNRRKANSIIDIIKRPIDTIKHQAKTITVGTQRIEQIKETNLKSISKKNPIVRKDLFYYKEFSQHLLNSSIDINKRRDIFFYSNELDETILYFAINYLNNLCSKFNLKKEFHLARLYDLNAIRKDNNNFLIDINYKYKKNIGNKQINILFSSKNIDDKNLFLIKKEIADASKEVCSSIDILKFSNNLLLSIISKDKFETVFNNLNENQIILQKSLELINNLKIKKSLINLIKDLLDSRNNVKFIGSGVNYNVSKIASKILSKKFNLACAHDVLENHKHIDMSAEPVLFVIISNINNSSYQMDAKSEIEKFISHGNIPILIVNSGDNRFNDMKISINGRLRKLITIKIGNIYEDIAFIPSVMLIEKIIKLI